MEIVYLQNSVVFILAYTVVCMQANTDFPQSVMLEVVVQKADDGISTFTCS